MNIIIVGGGFGGVKAALELNRTTNFSITLISDKDHMLYYPALYATATGKSKLQSILPLSAIFEGTRVKIVYDTITGYDPTRHVVVGKKKYGYDRVIFALGVVTSYFGIKGLDAYSYGIKSAPEIDRFQHHLHDLLNKDQHLDRNYVIVGAGPTGVELSAALASYLKFVSKRHDIKKAKVSIKLIEAAPRILPRMQESSSRTITRRLKNLGVTVMTGKKVESQDDDSIMVSGKDIPSHTVVWTSGVSNHPFFASHSTHFPLAPNGKVVVDDHLMVDSHAYVIGDNAATPYAGLAQTAVYDARYVARDIKRAARHEPRHAYKPFMPPVVIPVGTRWAAFEWRKLHFGGFIGYLIRRAADAIGYGELLRPRHALRAWRSEEWLDENCTRCM